MLAKKPPAPVAKKPASKKVDAPKVFDVAKPGKSAPSATSKPVLVSNRPLMQDPMVTEQPTDKPAAPAILPSAKKIVIQPLHEEATSDEAPAAEADILEPEPKAEPAATGAKPAKTDVTPEEEKSGAVDIYTPEADPPKPADKPEPKITVAPAAGDTAKADVQLSPEQSEAALKAAKEHDTALQKMIESEEYFLPINSVEKRRSHQVAAFGLLLILILALAWGDVALDAGLVSINTPIPHTHFIGK